MSIVATSKGLRPQERGVGDGDLVLVLYSHELFASGISCLLQGVGLKTAIRRTNRHRIAGWMSRLRPKVIFTEEAGEGSKRTISNILNLSHETLVIRISLSDNRILFHNEAAISPRLSDLIRTAIHVDRAGVGGRESSALDRGQKIGKLVSLSKA